MPLPQSYQFRPGARTVTFVPDQLIAGNLKLVTRDVSFDKSENPLIRGTLVGRVDATGLFVPALPSATDGSQNPLGIVVDTVDTTAGQAWGAIYEMGEFNSRYLTYDSSWTYGALVTACRKNQLFIKESLSNEIL